VIDKAPRPTDQAKTGTSSPSLLVVLAHPDDESLACGGLIAWCAATGIKVSLLCLTHGENGQTNNLDLVALSSSLKSVRRAELERAAAVLGITEVIVGNHEDGMLPWIEPELVESDILEAIKRLHPETVITFGADGLYWHPDHIAVHERATAVVASLGDDGPALYYVTLPAGAMRTVVNHAMQVWDKQNLSTPRPESILGVTNIDAFGEGAATPTLVITTRKFSVPKLKALVCHQSQLRDSALLFVSEKDAPRLLATEHYRRANVGTKEPSFLEQFR